VENDFTVDKLGAKIPTVLVKTANKQWHLTLDWQLMRNQSIYAGDNAWSSDISILYESTDV
jgi:hypothetical protein